MVKKIVLKALLSDEELKSMRGEFIDFVNYKTLIQEDCDAYFLENNGDEKLLFKFRKQVIQKDIAHLPVETFPNKLFKSSNNRGIASGKVDKSLMSNNVVGFVNPNGFKSKVIYANGQVSSYYRGNNVESMIAGYYDKPKVNKNSKIKKTNTIPCRLTEYTVKNKDEWSDTLPLIRNVDQLYKKLLPEQYQYQKQFCEKVSDFCIEKTIFTTLTVNKNWRTACHVDSGDLKQGFSAITVSEEGQWYGCFLGYPKFGVCVDVREGDLLIKDPHQYHCNTEFNKLSNNAKRITLVYYFREGMLNCQKK